MTKVKNISRVFNRFLIVLFTLFVTYMCTWPYGYENPSHMMDDTSYRNYRGVLSQPVTATTGFLDDEETVIIPAGTEIIYRFNEDGSVVYFFEYSEDNMKNSFKSHLYSNVNLTRDCLENQEEIENNYQQDLILHGEKLAEHAKVQRYYKYRFVPSRLVIAIPVGLVFLVLLLIFENKFEKPSKFTVLFSLLFLIIAYIAFVNFQYFVPCR